MITLNYLAIGVAGRRRSGSWRCRVPAYQSMRTQVSSPTTQAR
jgi:hypothetical protein